LAKFRRTEASVLVGDTFVRKLVEGPGTYDAWCQSFAIFGVAMVTLGAATLGTMNLYQAGIAKLLRLFPGRWQVLMASDIVVRSERWGALRESFERNPPAGFDPAMPWDSVIAASSYGVDGCMLSSWWSDHFVIPNTLAASAGSASHRIAEVDATAPPPRAVRDRSRSRKNKKDKKQGKDKKDKRDGGKPDICGNWNRRAGKCAKDGDDCPFKRRHICEVCGGSHRASETKCRFKMEGGGGKGRGGK